MKVIRNRFFNQTKESRFIRQKEFLQVIKLDISKKEKKKTFRVTDILLQIMKKSHISSKNRIKIY